MINTEALEANWKQNLDCWGGNSFQAKRWFAYLVEQYTAKERKYHSLNHVIYMLSLAETFKTKVHNWRAFYLAIWFHDAIQNKLTDNEKQSESSDAKLFVDLDLAILGSSKEEYRRYARQCRAEYKIPNFLYRREREHIYQSDLFRKRFEHQAQKNLNWEIAGLKKGVSL